MFQAGILVSLTSTTTGVSLLFKTPSCVAFCCQAPARPSAAFKNVLLYLSHPCTACQGFCPHKFSFSLQFCIFLYKEISFFLSINSIKMRSSSQMQEIYIFCLELEKRAKGQPDGAAVRKEWKKVQMKCCLIFSFVIFIFTSLKELKKIYKNHAIIPSSS